MWPEPFLRVGSQDIAIGDVFYALALVAGIAAFLGLSWSRFRWRAVALVVPSACLGIYSARTLGAVLVLEEQLTWSLFAHVSGGAAGLGSALGGVIGGGLSTALFAMLLGVPVYAAMDGAAVSVTAAQVFGRIGCFAYGCCFGIPTHLPWGVRYPLVSFVGFYGGPAPRHPVQIYEAILMLGLVPMLCVVAKRAMAGTAAFMFLVVYGMERFGFGFVRDDLLKAHFGLSAAQIVAIMVAMSGLVGIVVIHRSRLAQAIGAVSEGPAGGGHD